MTILCVCFGINNIKIEINDYTPHVFVLGRNIEINRNEFYTTDQKMLVSDK